jgi:hypothetical protein
VDITETTDHLCIYGRVYAVGFSEIITISGLAKNAEKAIVIMTEFCFVSVKSFFLFSVMENLPYEMHMIGYRF